MSLTRFFYEPFYSASDFDRLFDEAISTVTRGPHVRHPEASAKFTKPKMDIYENADGNTVSATFELPGLKKEDVNIDVHQNHLTVSGESTDSSERKEDGFALRERRYGQFSRTIQLPEGIKDSEIKAAMDNGLLTITFPKSAPEVTPKRLTIS